MTEVARLQSFLRAVASPGRTVVEAPPFTAFLDPDDALRFVNYSIPADGAAPDAAAVERLRTVFRKHGRLPRLEWIEQAAPLVARALVEAGMREELRTPLMSCEPTDLVDANVGVEELTVAPVGEADLRETADLQRVAFGDTPLAASDEPRDPRAHGGGAVLARCAGEPLAVAAWTPIMDGVTEIVGVATAEPWRGRGLAGAVTAAGARAAFAAGASLCVLSPGDDLAQRVYARAGFAPVATMLHWSDPD